AGSGYAAVLRCAGRHLGEGFLYLPRGDTEGMPERWLVFTGETENRYERRAGGRCRLPLFCPARRGTFRVSQPDRSIESPSRSTPAGRKSVHRYRPGSRCSRGPITGWRDGGRARGAVERENIYFQGDIDELTFYRR